MECLHDLSQFAVTTLTYVNEGIHHLQEHKTLETIHIFAYIC